MCKTSESLQPRVEKSREEVVMKTFGIDKMNLTRRCTKSGVMLLAIVGLCGCAGNVPEPPASSNNNATLPVIVSGTPRHDVEGFPGTDPRLKPHGYRAVH